MGFITPNPDCDCCPNCDSFDCRVPVDTFPFYSTEYRTVNAITFTIANTGTTNLHTNFGPNAPPLWSAPAPMNYSHAWIQITDFSSLLGNFTIQRNEADQCFYSQEVFNGPGIDGATIWGCTALDGSGCPSGTISSSPATAVDSAPFWKVTATFDNFYGLSLVAIMDYTAFEPTGPLYYGFSNGLSLGSDDPPDPNRIARSYIGLSWNLSRQLIQCDGGTLNIDAPGLNPVGGSFPPCSGYPTNTGLTVSYTLDL